MQPTLLEIGIPFSTSSSISLLNFLCIYFLAMTLTYCSSRAYYSWSKYIRNTAVFSTYMDLGISLKSFINFTSLVLTQFILIWFGFVCVLCSSILIPTSMSNFCPGQFLQLLRIRTSNNIHCFSFQSNEKYSCQKRWKLSILQRKW